MGFVRPVVSAVLEDEEIVVVVEPQPIPTQYESPTQKLVSQFEETAGFHARNWAAVIPKAASIEAPINHQHSFWEQSCAEGQHVSPDTTSYQRSQLAMVPVCVGSSGVVRAVALLKIRLG